MTARTRAGAGGLAANVDNVCPRCRHGLGMLHSSCHAGMPPAIAEGVGGDVEDAHDLQEWVGG